MYSIDESYRLVFKDNTGNEITLTEDVKKDLENGRLTLFPDGTKIINKFGDTNIYKLLFKDKSILTIFKFPIKCKIKDLDDTILLFSIEHLRLILDNLDYKRPFYYSKFDRKNIFLDKDKLEQISFIFDDYIEIKEFEENYEETIKNIYKRAKELYKNDENITYEFISQNYNKYCFDSTEIKHDLSETFDYIFTLNRKNLYDKVEKFLNINISLEHNKDNNKDKDEKINTDKSNNKRNDNKNVENIETYVNNNDNSKKSNIDNDNLISNDKNNIDIENSIFPICGPHGTGKTITSLYIHKSLFYQGKKGIYINIKYYMNDKISLEEKKETLIKECFFIVNDENEFLDIYKTFLLKDDFYDLLVVIKNFIIKKSSDNIYIILDQFQNKYNVNNILEQLMKIKIFLLSSINDFDVKSNLIFKYEDELFNTNDFPWLLSKNKIKYKIKYYYIENCVEEDYYELDKYRNMVRNKIKKVHEENDDIEKEFKYVYYILKKFGYLPKYFFGYISLYESIIDLLFFEYSNIFEKLNSFLYSCTIDLKEINNLIKDNILVLKDFSNFKKIDKEKLVKYLRYIPLKYINFTECQDNEFYFYYSFPLFKKILSDFNDYINSKELFFITKDEGERGILFEKILKIRLRAFQKLQIDGYIKFEEFSTMIPTKKYQILNLNYFESKNNVFLDQKKRTSESFDFAIYKAKKKELILIQSKYIVNKDTVSLGKSYYLNNCQKVLQLFNNISGQKVEKCFLLFISSYEYNYMNQESVFKILSNKRINCLFYSVKNDNFTFDFDNYIQELKTSKSYMIIPDSSSYDNQKILNNNSNKKDKKEKTLLKKKAVITLDLLSLRKEIMLFISKSKLKDEIIVQNLGEFKKIKSFDSKIKLREKDEYSLIFSLTKYGKFDDQKKMGLIFFQEGIGFYFYEFIENKTYENYEKFTEKFEDYGCKYYYIIGSKTNRDKTKNIK